MYESVASKRDELLQDIKAKIFDSLDSFEGKSSIKTWVYRLALNTCLKHVDKKKFDKLLDLDADVDLIPHDLSIEDKIDFKIMVEYASTFKPVDRELIYLYLIGESQNDIADILGLTVENVSTKISRLKIKIQNYLNKGAQDAK